MLSPDARAGKERISSTVVRPKIGKKVALDENSNSGPPIDTTIHEAIARPSEVALCPLLP
jgi:hypothetical protein